MWHDLHVKTFTLFHVLLFRLSCLFESSNLLIKYGIVNNNTNVKTPNLINKDFRNLSLILHLFRLLNYPNSMCTSQSCQRVNANRRFNNLKRII